MRSRRYKKTEEKILTVFFEHPEYTMSQLAEESGIARSTIYTHHHSVRQIIPDCEKIILKEYNLTIKKKLKKNKLEIKVLYLEMLIFIFRNREVFEIFLKFDDRDIMIKMVLMLGPKIKEPEKILRVFASEVAEIIFEWGERGFLEGEMTKTFSDIMYLTSTMRKRLGPLA